MNIQLFCIALVVAAESQDRHCYECTWDATTEISDKERNQKLDKREDLKTSDLPQKWILPQLRYFGKEALTRYPEAADLERLCGKCKLEPNRVCVKWKFYAINKHHPFNVTWSCVSSLERGCFEEKAGKDLFKEVCLCDNVDRCNRVPGQHSTISSSRALLVLALLAYRLLNYLVL